MTAVQSFAAAESMRATRAAPDAPHYPSIGPALVDGCAIWTDGYTMLWCAPGGVVDVLDERGNDLVSSVLRPAKAVPALRIVTTTDLFEGMGWGPLVSVGGVSFGCDRVRRAITSFPVGHVEIALIEDVLVMRCGDMGAAVKREIQPVDLLSLPEALSARIGPHDLASASLDASRAGRPGAVRDRGVR